MFRKTWFRGEAHIALFLKLVILLLLFFFSRIIFYLLNAGYFHENSFRELGWIFFAGLRFDASAVIILGSIMMLMISLPLPPGVKNSNTYRRIANVLYFIPAMVGLAGNFIDSIYFRFTLKRTTGDIFKYLRIGGDFGALVPQFLRDFWYIFLLWVLFCVILVWATLKIKAEHRRSVKNLILHYGKETVLFLVTATMALLLFRGGFQLRPIGIITAGQYTSSRNIPLVLNTPFSILKTIGKQELEKVTFYKDEQLLDKIYSPYHQPGGNGSFRPMNVCILILESFSLEHMGRPNTALENGKYRGFTPFLDSLSEHGLFFRGFANGKTSIDGIPAVLSGMPSLMNEAYITSRYAGNNLQSLAVLLQQKGYKTAFFHGGYNGTMGFDAYTRGNGFELYYGKNEYNNNKDYDGKWGIFDEPFLQYTAWEISKLHQPFFISFFSLSSHHPYTVPSTYAGKFRKGKLKIQESIMYSDFALMKFFNRIKAEPWFSNTLFVITADHTSEGYDPIYSNNLGQFRIPILFYRSDNSLAGTGDFPVQQMDIMPSVLDYLHVDQPYFGFGRSVFDTTATHFGIWYLNGLYSLVMGDHLLQTTATKPKALYDIRHDSLLMHNMLNDEPTTRVTMEKFARAFIQQYNNRIIENRLIAR